MGIVILILIIVLVIWFFINYWLSKQFYEVACMKGYDNKKYLWICFFFSIIGYLLVVALPNRNSSNNKKSNYSSNDLPEL